MTRETGTGMARGLALAVALAAMLAACGPNRKEADSGRAAKEAALSAGAAASAPAGLPPDQTTDAQRAANAAAAAAAGVPPTPFTRSYYDCGSGQEIEVRYFPEQGVAVVVLEGVNNEMQEARVGSGFEFVGQGITLRGQGDEATLTVGDQSVPCKLKAV